MWLTLLLGSQLIVFISGKFDFDWLSSLNSYQRSGSKGLDKSSSTKPQFPDFNGKAQLIDFNDLVEPDGSGKLGPEFKGVYVPDSMADAILEWMEENKREKEANYAMYKDDDPTSRQTTIKFEEGDPNVDIKKINNIIKKIAGIKIVEEAPWDPTAKEVFDKCLELHNKFRAIHYADPVQYDERLNKIAQTYANKLISDVITYMDAGMNHSYYKVGDISIGENLAWQYGPNPDESAKSVVDTAVNEWYNEIKEYYDFGQCSPVRSKMQRIGHFTALVWRDTRYIGLGMAKGKAPDGNTHYVVVVNYDPAGNVLKQYKENVLEPGKYGSGKQTPALKYHHPSIFPDHNTGSKFRSGVSSYWNRPY